MSLIGALNNALTGINVSTSQIQIASQNISDSSDEDYSNETANVEESASGGVQIVSYTRASNQALMTSLLNANSASGSADAQSKYMSQLDDLFGISTASTTDSGTPPLETDISNFISDWNALQSEPTSSTQQTQVISDATTITTQLQDLSSGLGTIQSQIGSDASSAVSAVNTDLTNIDSLNQQISTAAASGESTGSLEDNRDAAIKDLSTYISVNVTTSPTGQVQVTTPSGYSLVGSGNTAQFTYANGTVRDATGADVTSQLGNGQLSALTNMLSTNTSSSDPGVGTLAKMQAQLDSIATMFTSTTGSSGVQSFADAYASGTATTGQLASGFFTGTDASNISVNSALTDGTSTLNTASIAATYTALNASGRTDLSAPGLAASSTTYQGYVSNMFITLGSNINTASSNASTADATKSSLTTQLSSSTGVNVDDQVLQLSSLQNVYESSARVIQVVETMFTDLEGLIQ